MTRDRTGGSGTPRKRPLKWRIAEFAFWAFIAIVTAVIMVQMSETLLPSNF